MKAHGLIALVTGGNKGLGKGVVLEFALRGMTVYLGSRNVERGIEAVKDFAKQNILVSMVELDVTRPATVVQAAERIGRESGKLDILVNNAGIYIGAPSLDTSANEFREIYETNVFGVVTVTHEMLPLLRRSSTPRIVNVASATASHTLAYDSDSKYSKDDRCLAYASSKSALTMLTIQYANAFRRHPEFAHIKINSASPGYVATDLNNHQGNRSVAEGARIIVDLATIDDDGPSGGFFSDQGQIPW